MPVGVQDYKGYTNPQGIEIGNRAQRRPPTYHARCSKCGTEFHVSHRRVETEKCPMNCSNRTAQKPGPSLGSTGSKEFATRSSDSADSAAFRRSEADSGDDTVQISGKRNVRYSASKGLNGWFKSQGLTTDRARAEWRQHLAEEAAAEEAKFKPLREEFERLSQALALEQQRAIRDGVDRWFCERLDNDERINILAVAEMSDEEANAAQEIANELFKEMMVRQDFVPTQKISQTIFAYLERQYKALGLPACYASATLLIRAFGRCRLANLLEEVKHVVVSSQESVELESQQAEQREKAAQDQRDIEAADIASRTDRYGEVFTARQIEAMPSDTYRKHFPINRSGETMGDLLDAMRSKK